jgi:ATP-dependent Lon protease
MRIQGVKEKGLKLIELYTSLAKSESKILVNQLIKINQADPVKMLFLISSIIRYQKRDERRLLLEVNCFDERLEMLNKILTQEIERIGELLTKAVWAREERKEAVKTVFRKMGNKSGSPTSFMKHLSDSENGGAGVKKEELNEVEQLYQKLVECKLPEETQRIVEQEMKKLRNLDPRN